MKRSKLIIILFLLVLCLANLPVQAALLNGSFESPAGANPNVITVPTWWNYNDLGQVLIWSTTSYQAAPFHGSQMVLVGKNNGTQADLWQNTTDAMVQGVTYTLSWVSQVAAHEFNGGFSIVSINAADNISSEGSAVASLTYYDTDTNVPPAWATHSLAYTCDAAHAGKYLVVSISSTGNRAETLYDNMTITPPGATPTPTPTPTPVIEAFPIHGTIVFGDYDPVEPVSVAIKVDIRQGDTVVKTQNFLLDSGDPFSVDIQPGTYDVAIKACTWLQKVIQVDMESSAYDLGQIELIAGDLHGDNEVFFTSLSIVLKFFGTSGDE